MPTLSRRKFVLFATIAIVLVVVGPFIASRLRARGRQFRVRGGTPSVAAEPVTRLRILAYNIAHGRGSTDDNWQGTAAEKRTRVKEIAQFIEQTEADIVVLNEVDFCSTWSGHQNQAEAIAQAAGYPCWLEQRNLDFRFVYSSWKFGNAILSRFPVIDAETLRYPELKSTERILAGCKSGVICTLQLSDSQRVRVIPVHLEHRDEQIRIASASMIVDATESSPIPLIAAGDFNSTPTSFPESERDYRGNNAMEVLIGSRQFEYLPNKLPTRNEMTFPENSPTRVIDWILIPKGWRFGQYQSLASELSDHRPVLAEIRLPEVKPNGG